MQYFGNILQLLLHAFPANDLDIKLVLTEEEFLCTSLQRFAKNYIYLPLLYILKIYKQLFSRNNSQKHHLICGNLIYEILSGNPISSLSEKLQACSRNIISKLAVEDAKNSYGKKC